MKYSWPNSSKLTLFLDAEKNTTITVELKTNYEANLFRYALHNFRRRNPLYAQRFANFQISVDGNKLTVYKIIESEIKKTTPTQIAQRTSQIAHRS